MSNSQTCMGGRDRVKKIEGTLRSFANASASPVLHLSTFALQELPICQDPSPCILEQMKSTQKDSIHPLVGDLLRWMVWIGRLVVAATTQGGDSAPFEVPSKSVEIFARDRRVNDSLL
jgi:hypothetical protein